HRVRELVRADLVLVHHLRADIALRIHGEQRVVNHVAVIAHDVGSGPDRIHDLEIRVHDNAQRGLRRRGRADTGKNDGAREGEQSTWPHVGLLITWILVAVTGERAVHDTRGSYTRQARLDCGQSSIVPVL